MRPDAGIAWRWQRAGALVALIAMGCAPNPVASSSASSAPSSAASPPAATAAASRSGSVVIVGRIITMADPPVAEAVFIDRGIVAAVGGKDEILALAGAGAPVMDIGDNVAYPGFIDPHAHWIGDREYYGVATAAEAIDLAVSRGWTSIAEQWVNPERLDELTRLAADAALPLRVDAYLALNYDQEFLGDWYTDRAPGAVDDHLSVRGLKIHLDTGSGRVVNWEPAELTATIGRANDAGWQVSVHSMSGTAQDLVLDAFEAALGPTGPNPLHHRLEHVIQVTDEQLARMVDLALALVIHPDGESDWIMYDGLVADFDRQDPPPDIAAEVGRWRDFVDAGLHVAFATDAPWTFPDEDDDRLADLTDDMGRPVDHIAAAMDGRQRENPVLPAWLLDQLLTAEQGLRAVTLEAAWAIGDEARRGHLAVGTLGDVTILSGDVADGATPDGIRAMDVVATIVGGAPVYCAEPETCSLED